MADQTTSGNTVPAFLTKAEIKGNEEGEVSLEGGFVQLYYHESILQDSVRADYIFADTGNTIGGKSAMEGLPIVGTEDFTLSFADNNYMHQLDFVFYFHQHRFGFVELVLFQDSYLLQM